MRELVFGKRPTARPAGGCSTCACSGERRKSSEARPRPRQRKAGSSACTEPKREAALWSHDTNAYLLLTDGTGDGGLVGDCRASSSSSSNASSQDSSSHSVTSSEDEWAASQGQWAASSFRSESHESFSGLFKSSHETFNSLFKSSHESFTDLFE